MGNLNFSATEAELQSLVSPFGTIVSIKLNQKKGYAFIEMETAEEAGKVVRELDGTRHLNREIRLSLEMKTRKARSFSARRYKERGAILSRQRYEKINASKEQRSQDRPFSSGRSVRDGERPGAARSQKPESRYKPREQAKTSGPGPSRPDLSERTASPRPAKKPSSSGKPFRDSRRTGAARGKKSESRYKPRDHSSASESKSVQRF